MAKLTDRVSSTKKVTFVRFQRGELWYKCEDGFEFPVPVNDTGDGEFKSEDKSTFFMRWIRKHMEYIERSRLEQ